MEKNLTLNVVLSFYDNEISFSICPNKSKAADYLKRQMLSVQAWFDDLGETLDTVTKTKNETDFYIYAKSVEGNIGISSIVEVHSRYSIAIYDEEHINFKVEEFTTEEEMDNAYNVLKANIVENEESEDGMNCVGINEKGYTTAIIKVC